VVVFSTSPRTSSPPFYGKRKYARFVSLSQACLSENSQGNSIAISILVASSSVTGFCALARSNAYRCLPCMQVTSTPLTRFSPPPPHTHSSRRGKARPRLGRILLGAGAGSRRHRAISVVVREGTSRQYEGARARKPNQEQCQRP